MKILLITISLACSLPLIAANSQEAFLKSKISLNSIEKPAPEIDQVQKTIEPIQMKLINDFVKKTTNCQLELGSSCARRPSARSLQ
jgi:hypothetical protein